MDQDCLVSMYKPYNYLSPDRGRTNFEDFFIAQGGQRLKPGKQPDLYGHSSCRRYVDDWSAWLRGAISKDGSWKEKLKVSLKPQ